jgi:5-methylcytosine-specific restriction protein A
VHQLRLGNDCIDHERIQRSDRLGSNKERGSAHSRGYTAQQKWRATVLHRDPFCKIKKLCRGFSVSTEADHIVPIQADGARFDLANGHGACKPCHASKTAIEDSSFANRKKRGH